MTNIALADLEHVTGGETVDPTAVAKRAAEHKPGHGSIDIFGYGQSTGTSNSAGVGAEVRQRLNPNISVFGRGTVGTKDDKPDASIMGGFRVEW